MSDKMRNAFKEVICGAKRTKNHLYRNSTFRDTYSKSCNFKVPRSPSHVETVIDQIDEEKINLVNKDIVSASISKSKASFDYDIHYKNKENINIFNNETTI